MRKFFVAAFLVALIMLATTLAVKAAERDTPERDGSLVQLTAGATVEKGCMVAVWTNGLAYEAADTAGYVVVGRAENTAAAGAKVTAKRGVFRWANAGSFTAKDIGTRCYVHTSDGDYSVTDLATSANKVPAGYIVDIGGTAYVWVDTYNESPLISTSVATLAITGNSTVGGTLGVTGASTLTGNTAVGGTLGVTGASTLTGALTANGAATFNGAVTLTNAAVVISNLPSSTNGLTPGRLYLDSGAVKVYADPD